MKYLIKEIIDVDRLQRLMDKFYAATGTGTSIIDLEGGVITASGWQDICTKFHRINPVTCKKCLESDTALANSLAKGKKINIYRCLNGLVDVAMPIHISGNHIANLFIGQFLTEKPDLDFFRKQAKEYDFSENEYLEALAKVPILTETEVKAKLLFLTELTNFIGEIGIHKQEKIRIKKELETRVEKRTKALKDAQMATMNIMQDVEEERNRIEKLNIDLQKTNLELEAFAYVASHDLQEPLRKISSFTELMAKRYSDNLDERGLKYMKYITTGAKRMQQLISDLLQFSRVGSREKPFESVSFDEILTDVVDNLSVAIEEKKAVVNINELPILIADKMQMGQLWQNLLTNALEFSSEKPPEILIKSKEMADYWLFSLSDNGIGIEQEYKDKIFVIFQRLHNREKYTGTGIGLAICKKIVERHGGAIWFESEPDVGTTFYFTLSKNLENQ